MNDWTPQQARLTYNIPHWGGGYFDVDEQGSLVARPDRNPHSPGVDLFALSQEIRAQGLSLPVLVRFTDILHNRVKTLVDAFAAATAQHAYEGNYTAVYPIKVNQQRSVVEEILRQGDGCVGLEAGSKPELMAVMALAPAGGTIICNGYKDREYIRLALVGRRLGHRLFIVVEKLSELELILEESRTLGIKPLLGVRLRLASIGAGKWQNTGGEKAKFGLSSSQVLQAVDKLKQHGLLDCLELLHFHLGSQIANIRDIQRGAREAARHYAELRQLGVPLHYVDVGGGLGIDYEGTRSRSFCSMNYGVEEYAANVVHTLWEVCTEHDLPHPNIITESGRAMTAHHAVLITNVIDIEYAPDHSQIEPPAEDEPFVIHDLWNSLNTLSERSALEVYHEAVHWVNEAQSMYIHGVLGLAQRARAEQLYAATCSQVRPLLKPTVKAHREVLDELNDKLADKFFCNLSVFQSVPDVWAIDQIFPIVPLHRLDERPNRRAVIQDLTCDSDGRIDYYVDDEGVETTLPLHEYRPEEPYLLGFFLVGAYQEILGDMHNLFGDTDSINVVMNPDGSHRLEQPRNGDPVDVLLRWVGYQPEQLLEAYHAKIAAAGLDAHQQSDYLAQLEAGLEGYTYLED